MARVYNGKWMMYVGYGTWPVKDAPGLFGVTVDGKKQTPTFSDKGAALIFGRAVAMGKRKAEPATK